MTASRFVAIDPVSGAEFSRSTKKKTGYYGAIVIDGRSGPEVFCWVGRESLVNAQLMKANRGSHYYRPHPEARVALAKPAAPKSLAGLKAHPWVESVSDERSSGCGIWVYLKPGYEWDRTAHSIHESTVRDCCAAFSAVVEIPADEMLQDAG